MNQTIAASVGQSWFASRTVRRQWKSLSLASSHRRLWTTRDKETAPFSEQASRDALWNDSRMEELGS